MSILEFRRELKTPIDLEKVIEVRASGPGMSPEVTVVCEVDEDDKSCTFRLTGPTDTIESLPLPMAASVLIEVAN